MSDKKNKPNVYNIFYNETPTVYIQQGNYILNNVYEYNADSYKLYERYFQMPNVDPNKEISFQENQNNIKGPHVDVHKVGASVAGNLAGDVVYDMVVNGSINENTVNVSNISKQVFKAGVMEGLQSSSAYAMAYTFGAEAVVPVKLAWTTIETSSILKKELDYLKENNILTRENIEKAQLNAVILGASGAFMAEIKFISKTGELTSIFTSNATGSFLSRSIKDSYNYEPHEPGYMEKFYIFRTRYIKYPIVFVIGSVGDGIDYTIDKSYELVEGGYYWLKGNSDRKPDVVDITANKELIDRFYKSYNVKSLEDIIREKIQNDNLLDFNNLLEDNKVKQETNTEDEKTSEIVKKDNDDIFCDYDVCEFEMGSLEKPKNSLEEFENIINGSDIKSINSIVQNINNLNNILEGANIIKNWKNMTGTLRERTVIGLALKNFNSPNLSSHELSIIHGFGALLMKDNITPEDFALFVASFPDTPLPIVNFLKFTFAAINGDDAAVKQAFLGVTLGILSLSNPVFTVAQVLMTTFELVSQLLTKVEIINISGIEAQFTDKIRVKGFLKVYHKCSIDNDFFGIHVSASGKHSADVKAQLEQQFNDQAFYKVVQVIGYPAKVLDPNLKIEGRLNSMLWNKYIIAYCTKWLQINKKYLTPEEYKEFKRSMFETEDDKKFRTWLNDNGYDLSWFSNHRNENPIEFFNSIFSELKDCRLIEGFNKFLSLFGAKKGVTPPMSDAERAKVQARLKGSRSKSDNDDTDNFNDSENDEYQSGTGAYSKLGLIKSTNKIILDKHISVGYIFDTASSSVFNNIGSSIAYIDQECIMIYRQPIKYICYKSEQLATSFYNNYVTNSVTEHLMTLPTILIDDNILTDAMLGYVAPAMNMFVGAGVNTISSFMKGKNSDEIFNDVFNAGLNGSLTSGLMSLAKDTFLMQSLTLVSEKFSTSILLTYGIAIPQAALSTIVISTSLCLIQRIGMAIYAPIHKKLSNPDKKKLEYMKQATMIKTNDIFADLKSDDLFFNKQNDDPFFTDKFNKRNFNQFSQAY